MLDASFINFFGAGGRTEKRRKKKTVCQIPKIATRRAVRQRVNKKSLMQFRVMLEFVVKRSLICIARPYIHHYVSLKKLQSIQCRNVHQINLAIDSELRQSE